VKLQAATQLQDLLSASGLNQEQLADKVGVKPAQVSRILNALGNPTVDTLVKMAGALGYAPHLTFVPIQSHAAPSAALVAQTPLQSTLGLRRKQTAPKPLGRKTQRELLVAKAD
jgi:transcriptional regulator with XRE-family HTH domain